MLIGASITALVALILLAAVFLNWQYHKALPSTVSHDDGDYFHFATEGNNITFTANEFLMLLVALARRWGALDVTYRDVLLANWHLEDYNVLGDPGIIIVKKSDSAWGNISMRDCTYQGDVAAVMENIARLIEAEDPR